MVDAQIEKVIAEVTTEFYAECHHSHEICGECAEAGLRELAQRVLEIAIKKGTDHLLKPMDDDEYWSGGRGHNKGIAAYVKVLRSLADGPKGEANG